MMTTICSACGAALSSGSLNCPNCNLPIMALAVQRPEPRHVRFPYWIPGVALGVGLLYGLSSVEAKNDREHDEKADAALASVEAAHRAFANSLSDTKTFQARCGAPTSIQHGISTQDMKDLDAGAAHGAVTFIYRQPMTEMHVIFTKDKDIPVLFREHSAQRIFEFTPYPGLVEMGCVSN